MADPHETAVVIPAYNEVGGIGALVAALAAAGTWHQLLVVDDGSTDGTGDAAHRAGATVLRHPYNKGNGAAVKTGIRHATAEYVLVIDGDGQHRPDDAQRLVAPLGEFDLVIGARSRSTQATLVRALGNDVLNRLASYLAGRRIPDLTSGFRAARREHLLEFLHLLPNGFSTPTTTTLAFLRAGYNVTFVAVEARTRQGTSKVHVARDGARFFVILLKVVTVFSPLRVFAPISVVSIALGLVYGLWTVAESGRIANGAVLLLMFGVIVFLVGLVSEQVAALRSEGPRR